MLFHFSNRLAWLAAGVALSAAATSAQVNAKINFEPFGASTPLGYKKNHGAPYSPAAGSGWVTEASLASATHVPVDLGAYTRDRARAGIDPRRNTLIHMQFPNAGKNGAFEYNVPNGSYKVVVCVGDQGPYDSFHTIRVEGATVISSFVGSAATEFKVDSATVTVSDGRVTVDAKGGTNTKLNYVHIATAGLPPEPAPVNLKINFQNAAATVPAGYLRDYGQAFGARTSAGQGSGLTYGWVAPGTSTPRDLSLGGTGPGNGRNRGTPTDARIATFMHMQADQLANFNGTPLPGTWEIGVPNNWYTVTVAVGDPTAFDSQHRILLEGQVAIAGFVPTAANLLYATTMVVQVIDGRLSMTATNGLNTKVAYITAFRQRFQPRLWRDQRLPRCGLHRRSNPAERGHQRQHPARSRRPVVPQQGQPQDRRPGQHQRWRRRHRPAAFRALGSQYGLPGRSFASGPG
jgi:hypothetical protein